MALSRNTHCVQEIKTLVIEGMMASEFTYEQLLLGCIRVPADPSMHPLDSDGLMDAAEIVVE